MEDYKYSINEIFEFEVGTKFQDLEGNTYKINQDEEYFTKTLKYAIVTEKLLNSKFKIIN